ncbi:hypothetical protein WJX73_005235 [Symbiochloris irregularis]|uniref:Uric acid-xanthine permease n=1 Tax=Symbiochloris irregularis TaxID=706552 RepID=A0AAW1NV02_9CHLO
MGLRDRYLPEDWRENQCLGKFDFSGKGIDLHDPKDIIIGNYDWGYLCWPTWPYCRAKFGLRERPIPPFYPVNQLLSICVALLMGLQHALAMVGGLITPPLLVGLKAFNDPTLTSSEAQDRQTQLVASSLIVTGICTIVHVIQIPIPFTKMVYGTGVISVAGISFTFLLTAENSVDIMMQDGDSFDVAYGRFIGVLLATTWLVVAISFMNERMVKRIFPPLVPGVTIFLIGAALIGTGFQNWGGGAYCAEYANGLPAEAQTCLVPYNTTIYQSYSWVEQENPNLIPESYSLQNGSNYMNGTCYSAQVTPLCGTQGHVQLPFGAPEYVGLGFLVFVTLCVIEIFGSPFMRNAEVIIALLFGYLIAGVVTRDGQHYVNTSAIDQAPGITFLWVRTYPIGFFAPAVLPCLVAFLVTAVEAIGDITATEEASRLPTAGSDHRRRIQGGLLGDGVNCFFGALAFTLPTTTFAQNNGVIVLTRCASRSAGVCCGLWLFLFGVIAKIGAFFVAIPYPILGGMTTFLFACVAVSGIKIIILGGLGRRVRFITAIALGLGLGVTIVPGWATNHLWPIVPSMSEALRSFRDACILVLSNGFAIGCIASILLHLLLPEESDPNDPDAPIKDPQGDRSFTTHPKSPESNHVPASVYNDQKHGNGDNGELYKEPMNVGAMQRGDDTAHHIGGKEPIV